MKVISIVLANFIRGRLKGYTVTHRKHSMSTYVTIGFKWKVLLVITIGDGMVHLYKPDLVRPIVQLRLTDPTMTDEILNHVETALKKVHSKWRKRTRA